MDRTDVDGLPASEVGIWALEKHELLRKYVTASHGARRHFQGRTSYIDLYCGPGRSWVRETGAFIDGSPLVAFDAGSKHGDQFGEIYLADNEHAYVDACRTRIIARDGSARTCVGPAVETVRAITSKLHPRGLHFGFLDPFNLTDLPFSVIEELARFEHMDMLIHVSAMHLKRELPKWMASEAPCELDVFAPGWRRNVDVKRRQDMVRRQVFQYWCDEIRRLRMSPSERVRAVENSKGGELYWLVLVSRHELADKLWKDVSARSAQGEIFG